MKAVMRPIVMVANKVISGCIGFAFSYDIDGSEMVYV